MKKESLNTEMVSEQSQEALLQKLLNRVNDLENENANLRTVAERDSLTGCLRREAFMTLIERRRSFGLIPKNMTMAIVDLDHFKIINDTYGHLAGDKVLKELSQQLLETAPEGTLVCRMGGEEFVLLMPLPLNEAVRELDRIREQISSTKIQISQPTNTSAFGSAQQIQVTASFGAAAWNTDRALIECTAKADAALYSAKAAGRNRVRVAA